MALEQSTFPELALNSATCTPPHTHPFLMCDRHLRWLTWPSHFTPEHSEVFSKYFEIVRWQRTCRETNACSTCMQKVFLDSEILISKFSVSKTVLNHNNAKLQIGLPHSTGVAQTSPRGDVARSSSGPEEKVMYLCRWGLQSLSSFWWTTSGDRHNPAAGHPSFAGSCSSPPGTLTHHPQVAGTGQAAPALWGRIRLDHACRKKGSLKPMWLSSAPASLVWVCLLLPAYFLPLTT